MAVRSRCDLLADVGGTHSRFALRMAHGIESVTTVDNEKYSDLKSAIEAYLAGDGGGEKPRRGVVAVAAPVAGDKIALTNRDWSFSTTGLRQKLALSDLVVLNDFEALALALPDLDDGGTVVVRPGQAVARAPRVVLGPGTGLGVACLVECCGQRIPVPGEGGHRDLAPATERERQVAEVLAAKFRHVSCERVVSGPGLANLAGVLRQLAGEPEETLEPPEVARRAAARSCPFCVEAAEIWSAQLGAVAGDHVLVMGARGGVYLGGGVLGKMGEAFRVDAFLDRFAAKGRAAGYLKDVPIYRIDHPYPGILGASRALAEPVLTG